MDDKFTPLPFPISTISYPATDATDDTAHAGERSSSTQQHRAKAPAVVQCFVITVSSSRTPETDVGGDLVARLLEEAGHEILGRQLVADDLKIIRNAVLDAHRSDADAIIVTGGSGIGRHDVTPEALEPLVSKPMPGFGETFRALSWAEVGAATMLSRAFAGVIQSPSRSFLHSAVLFVLPGSPNAVQLAMDKLIVPELGHLIAEIQID